MTMEENSEEIDVEDVLLQGKELSHEEIVSLRERLHRLSVKEIKSIAKRLSIHLTGSSKKADIIERLMAMAQIGAIQKHRSREEDINISYLTQDIKDVLRSLPPFSSISEWGKKLDSLKDFTFMNLLVYLVYGRDRSFDMEFLKAFKSLKAYKFFHDGFVRNVWVHQFPSTNQLNLKVLCFRGFVHHSLSCESPLQVYVALNGDTGDVYSAQCSCVSG